jgi:hypothetical protein
MSNRTVISLPISYFDRRPVVAPTADSCLPVSTTPHRPICTFQQYRCRSLRASSVMTSVTSGGCLQDNRSARSDVMLMESHHGWANGQRILVHDWEESSLRSLFGIQGPSLRSWRSAGTCDAVGSGTTPLSSLSISFPWILTSLFHSVRTSGNPADPLPTMSSAMLYICRLTSFSLLY